MNTVQSHRVVVVGGGFGGLYTISGLRRAPVEITLVDRRNCHHFQPLLYQVSTGGLSSADISSTSATSSRSSAAAPSNASPPGRYCVGPGS